MTRRLAVGLLLLLAASITLVVRAPAAWLGDWLEARSKLRLVDARGTVWRGSALVGLSDGRATTLVPERIEWRIDLFPRAAAELSHPWLTAPLRIAMEPDVVAFQQGKAILPAGVLASAGAPFNTLKPGGVLEVAWSDARLRGAALDGEVQIDWRDATSALSPIAPLGTYRVRVSGRGDAPSLELKTLSGPLRMQGSGRINGSQVRFRGTADAEAGMRPALDGLLGVLGMRSGDKVLLAIDT